MPGSLRRPTTYLAAALAAVASIVAGTAVTRALNAGDRVRADGEVLLVQANLQDALRGPDAADTTDLDHFAERLLGTTPKPPDALLLTEVLGPGAEHLARTLGRRTGDSYRVLAAGGRSAFLADGAVRESAIIVNTDTLRAAGKAEFVRVQDEDQAFLPVRQRRTGVRWNLFAGHVPGEPGAAATALASHLSSQPQGIGVIGADFAVPRCTAAAQTQLFDCPTRPFWANLTQTHAYDDAAFVAGGVPTRPYTNFLFARAHVVDAFMDTAYDEAVPDLAACKAAYDAGRSRSTGAGCRQYYADTPFTWALVKPGDARRYAVFPAAVTMDRCEANRRVAGVAVRVVNGTDAETTTPVRVEAAAPLVAVPAAQAVTVPAGEARDTMISLTAVRSTTPAGDYPVTVEVGGQTTRIAVTVPDDCFVAPATATSYHPGFEPEQAVDGDDGTFWHSEWDPPQPLPQSITLNLGEVRSIGTVTYLPRQDGSANGTILDYTIFVSTDGDAFTAVANGTWAEDRLQKTATFTAAEVAFVRLEATRAVGPYASAAEITVR